MRATGVSFSMQRKFTRREAVLLGGVGVLTSLAGCSGGGAAPPDDEGGGSSDESGSGGSGGETGDQTDGNDGNEAPVAVRQAVVGELADLGALSMAVTSAERVPTAPLFGNGVEFAAGEGNEYVRLEFAIRSADYIELVFDLLSVAVDGTEYRMAEAFDIVDMTSPETGGLPFAPGELRRFRYHYEVPAGEAPTALRVLLRTRTLPATTYTSVPPLQVDLRAGSPGPELEQAFDLEFERFGERVVHEGIEMTIGEVTFGPELQNDTPDEGNEFLAFPISVTNGGDRPNPILVSLGGFGGLSLVDGGGNRAGDNVEFTGDVLGQDNFDPTNGIAPGETEAGVIVGEVAAGTDPLYLVWSPPTIYWRSDRHRYVWQIR
jgi:hypothetical protein